MGSTLLKRTYLFLILVALPVNLYAKSTPEELAREYVEAINASSVEKYEALMHPDCPPEKIPAGATERFLKHQMVKVHEIIVKNLEPDAEVFKFFKPAIPVTKQITIMNDNEKGRRVGTNLFAAEKNGNWYVVNCGEHGPSFPKMKKK